MALDTPVMITFEWTADDHTSEIIELNSETPGDFG